MFNSFPFVVLVLTISLAACGNEGGSAPDSGASNTPGQGAQTVSHPLATLTAERLDAYIDILRAAAADPDKERDIRTGLNDVDIAVERGWSIGEWQRLDMAVMAVAAEGYEQMLERQRTKSKEAREQIADYESRLATASEGDRRMIEGLIPNIRNAVAGWDQTLADADVLRPGGNLVESRLADIKAAKGQ